MITEDPSAKLPAIESQKSLVVGTGSIIGPGNSHTGNNQYLPLYFSPFMKPWANAQKPKQNRLLARPARRL